MKAIGLMSGTSLDGIDAACVRIEPDGARYDLELLRFSTVAFDPELARALRAALPPNRGSVEALASLHRLLGIALARAARAVAAGEGIDYVASHGHTMWHDGDRCVTLQAGDPFAIREAIKASVCYDFRSADCAAGGHGAPLIPYVDALLFGGAGEDRVALNLGGIANVTLLSKDPSAAIRAFDTGPGNMLIDALVRARTNAAFDERGSFAAAGRADAKLLSAMLEHEYFERPAPKSTGREAFGSHFFDPHATRLDELSLEDAAATVTELTAASVAGALEREGFASARIFVSGGGAHNATLLARLAERLPQARVETSQAVGVPVDAKEAMGFALLGYETLRGRPSNVPSATGASTAVALGAIAPYELPSLLRKVERECAAASS